jgi:hypothetical protein
MFDEWIACQIKNRYCRSSKAFAHESEPSNDFAASILKIKLTAIVVVQ